MFLARQEQSNLACDQHLYKGTRLKRTNKKRRQMPIWCSADFTITKGSGQVDSTRIPGALVLVVVYRWLCSPFSLESECRLATFAGAVSMNPTRSPAVDLLTPVLPPTTPRLLPLWKNQSPPNTVPDLQSVSCINIPGWGPATRSGVWKDAVGDASGDLDFQVGRSSALLQLAVHRPTATGSLISLRLSSFHGSHAVFLLVGVRSNNTPL
jgi:hypothetical protein